MTYTPVQDPPAAAGEENIVIFLQEIRAYPRLTPEEERRLAYVGITRAKKRLFLKLIKSSMVMVRWQCLVCAICIRIRL